MSFLPKFLTGRPKAGFELDSWDEIATLDQFKSHVKGRLGGRAHIRPHERECLEFATAKYGMTKNDTQCWGDHDIEEFLATGLPNELRSALRTARPLLYRCMARMSSYPYLDEPQIHEHLAVDDMLAGLSISLLRPSWLGHPDPMASLDATVAAKWQRKVRALLFRSMRLPKHSIKKVHEVTRLRSEPDDEDLRQAHLLLTRSRRYQSERWPTKLKPGPAIISLQELPSSNSTDLNGYVPRDEFESLFTICVCLESGGQDVKLKAETSHPSRGVDWEEFDATIASAPMLSLERLPVHLISEIGSQSSFLRGMALLFLPFVSPVEKLDVVGEHEVGKKNAGQDTVQAQ